MINLTRPENQKTNFPNKNAKEEIRITRTDKNLVNLSEFDMKTLKESILFKNWTNESFLEFLEENRIFLKKFR